MTAQVPDFAIIMAVHNARETVQLATQRTLRHIAGQSARLIVVDNGSDDGVEEWLRVLARRGDIDLIRNESNMSHGPAIEQALRQTQSPYIVTLDSDAWPLAPGWLTRLRGMIQGDVKAAGILHHRGYVHPSCTMIERATVESLNLSFLKDRSRGIDVGERIAHDLRRAGFRVAGLPQTGGRMRGGKDEPIWLGSEYGGIVCHQWYSSRQQRDRAVDDVPVETIRQSQKELLAGWRAEPREVTVILGIRVNPDEPERLRNVRACLWSLNLQDLERWRYRIVLIEQAKAPSLHRELGPLVDRYVFAYNPGPYNRGWAFNIGARLAGRKAGPLLLADADVLLPSTALRLGMETAANGRNAFLGFREVAYLDAASTERAICDRIEHPGRPLDVYDYEGSVFQTSVGCCFWVKSDLYHHAGGHDERFRGWGREDREFRGRIAALTKVRTLAGCVFHLDHPRPAEEDAYALENRRTFARLEAGEIPPASFPFGDLLLYADEPADAPIPPPAPVTAGDRVEAGRQSTRWHLEETVARLGGSILEADRCVARYPDRSFDVVSVRHLVESLEPSDAGRVLRECARVARRALVVDFDATNASRQELAGDRYFPNGVIAGGWELRERFKVIGRARERDEIWVFHREPHLNSNPVAGPKVSIVMPTYRRSHTILRTLDTIRAQSYTNWELIVVDNAGDGGYGFGDPRIRVVCHKVGPSSSHARNQGVRVATGDLICFFDDDDEMFPHYLERFVAAFERNPCAKMVRAGMIVGDGTVNYSFATPEVCLRRELATPTWDPRGGAQDQRYFRRILEDNNLSEEDGSIAVVREALSRAITDPVGGLRSGNF